MALLSISMLSLPQRARRFNMSDLELIQLRFTIKPENLVDVEINFIIQLSDKLLA